jgi:hypothetical protein
MLAQSARPHVGRLGVISAGGGHGHGGCDASCVCGEATEKCYTNIKISFSISYFIFLLHIVKHITIHVMLIVAWPEPEPLFGPMKPRHIKS